MNTFIRRLAPLAALWLAGCAAFPPATREAELLRAPLSADGAAELAHVNSFGPQGIDERIRLATQTRRAWFDAVAAQELLVYFAQVKDAADASGELARRMQQAGNLPRLAQLREQAFQADAAAGLAQTQQEAAAARRHLARLLRVPDDRPAFELPARLPALPDTPQPPPDPALKLQEGVRDAYAAYLAAYGLAKHCRDEVLPLRKRIADEMLLHYNGMLLGVFELLADARENVHATAGCVRTLRDHWIAQAELQAALQGRWPAP